MPQKKYIVDIELKVFTVRVTANNHSEAKRKAKDRLMKRNISKLIDHTKTGILELP